MRPNEVENRQEVNGGAANAAGFVAGINSRGQLNIDGKASARRIGLYLPDGLPINVWQRIGKQLYLVSDSSSWWLGDWLVYGEEVYPDRYRAAIAGTSLDYQTLRNYAWVARKFHVSRRRDKLSFHHHMEVAALCFDEQEIWLGRAERNNWSRNELRKRVRQSRVTRNGATPATFVRLRADADQEERWQRAAVRQHKTLEDWAISVLDQASGSVPSDGTPQLLNGNRINEAIADRHDGQPEQVNGRR